MSRNCIVAQADIWEEVIWAVEVGHFQHQVGRDKEVTELLFVVPMLFLQKSRNLFDLIINNCSLLIFQNQIREKNRSRDVLDYPKRQVSLLHFSTHTNESFPAETIDLQNILMLTCGVKLKWI